MEHHQATVELSACYTPADDSGLPAATYVLSGGSRLVIIDPGPASHLRVHLDSITNLMREMEGGRRGTIPLVAVVLAPGPGCFDGLDLIRSLSARRSVVVHRTVAMQDPSALDGWTLQPLATRRAGLPLATHSKLTIGISPRAGLPGSLLAFETAGGTLFSGPFFGSIGTGRNTKEPVLRRESVRAHRDLFTPGVPPDVVRLAFGSTPAITRIAPTHGRLAVGGESLIATVFEDSDESGSLPVAMYRLFVRVAALVGEETAAGVFRATGVPLPDLTTGYLALRSGAVPGLHEDQWNKVLDAIDRWVSGPSLAAVYPLVAELARRHGLPLPPAVERFANASSRAAGPPLAATVASRSVSINAPEAGAPAGGPAELTDPVTGLMNESVFKRRLADQLKTADRAAGSGALMLIGVDDVQRINSTFGRESGDQALFTVAYLLRNFQASHSRMGAHRLYKLGGPHFAYVLTSGTLAEAAEVAERVRRSIAESAMFVAQLTVSIGVVGIDEMAALAEPASAPEGNGTGGADPAMLAEEVTSRAFGRLRIARLGGANNVCTEEPEAAVGVGLGTTVLIADPDAPYLEMLTGQLEDRGYAVLLARDGAEALEIIEQIVPDAIVSEVMLPKVNGFDLRERLRHNVTLNRIPFILVSHRKTDETVERASTLGIVHFLAKPFSLVELTGLLGNLAGKVSDVDAAGGRP